jgi:hypothetical protein
MPDGSCPGMPQVTVVDDQFGTHRVLAGLRGQRRGADLDLTTGITRQTVTGHTEGH